MSDDDDMTAETVPVETVWTAWEWRPGFGWVEREVAR